MCNWSQWRWKDLYLFELPPNPPGRGGRMLKSGCAPGKCRCFRCNWKCFRFHKFSLAKNPVTVTCQQTFISNQTIKMLTWLSKWIKLSFRQRSVQNVQISDWLNAWPINNGAVAHLKVILFDSIPVCFRIMEELLMVCKLTWISCNYFSVKTWIIRFALSY